MIPKFLPKSQIVDTWMIPYPDVMRLSDKTDTSDIKSMSRTIIIEVYDVQCLSTSVLYNVHVSIVSFRLGVQCWNDV